MQATLLRLGVLLIMAPALCSAELGDERLSISLGGFITDRDTRARLDGEEIGDEIDWEDLLGLESSGTVFRADGYLRFGRRHRLDFAVFDLSRSATVTINEEFEWGDEIYEIGTTIDAAFDLLILKLAYSWSIVSNDTWDIGVSGGLYTSLTETTIEESATGANSETGDLTVPLPVIGLRGAYALAPRWTLRASAQYFGIEIEGVDGSLLDLQAGIDYRLTDRFSLGVGYNEVNFDVDSTNDDFPGSLDWRYGGTLLYFKGDFGSVGEN